ncbi:MAG TPA: DHH family phosphoesterase [Candidatus Saccharimonadales bacterium]|nr:DHH family phosphoesterase [Candidatus Saccharimonadales bacterium]
MYAESKQIKEIVAAAQKIVIVQADNPDADSLGSALALEHILGDLGKDTCLYAGTDVPTYLRYLEGWDRVQPELPHDFDASIIVDASTMSLLEKLMQAGYQQRLATKPCVVLDHHASVENVVPFAEVILNDHENVSSAGELIYRLATELTWPVSVAAQSCLMTAILGDTQGLSNQLARADTYRVMADMVEAGVNRPALEELRREAGKMPPPIFTYKARLIARTRFTAEGRIAWVDVPQQEITEYSPLYNPGPLVQGDMLQTKGVEVAIVLKRYDDGKVTGAIRCNPTAGVAADLAARLGGGGHAFASGFKVTDGRSFEQVRDECLAAAEVLLSDRESDK